MRDKTLQTETIIVSRRLMELGLELERRVLNTPLEWLIEWVNFISFQRILLRCAVVQRTRDLLSLVCCGRLSRRRQRKEKKRKPCMDTPRAAVIDECRHIESMLELTDLKT